MDTSWLANDMKLNLFKHLFGGNVVKESTSWHSQHDASRHLVAKFASGNTNLQLGRYSTEKEIDERRIAVCSYRFSEK